MARHAATSGRRTVYIVAGVLLAAVAAAVVTVTQHPAAHPRQVALAAKGPKRPSPVPTTSAPTTSTLPPASPGFVAGHVTAVGDSVMLDYETPLQADVPGIVVDAAVSRQWDDGVALLEQLKSEDQLGDKVVVALGTNGPITTAQFDQMMGMLDGASRVVVVTVHVDRPWQDPNNQVLAQGATQYPNVVLADWATLADQNPSWFGSDGTHLAIDGPGATALASLIASKLSAG